MLPCKSVQRKSNSVFKRRHYRTGDDYWTLRAFLREVMLCNDRWELSWSAARLDYWWWFGNPHLEHYRLEDVIHIWETTAGDIIAALTPESRGNAYLHVHPDFHTPELDCEMMSIAEETLALAGENGRQHLTVWAHQHDTQRGDMLTSRGYVKGDWPESQYRRRLDEKIPDTPPASGYTIRALGDIDELPARSWLSWRAFHPDEPNEAYGGWEWYPDVQRCPLYRRDLDLVAAAPDGALAGFTTIWFDDVTRTGYFEPVGVAPEHQRRGLGRALMNEGLRRLKRYGGVVATVGGYSEAANALYRSVMSPEHLLFERWEKRW